MFEWIKEKKLQSLLDRARIFLAQNYEEPYEPEEPEETEQQSSGAKHSDRDGGQQGPRVQYQRLSLDDRPKFSSRDNYDSDTVQYMLRNMSATTPISKVLRDLDANTNMSFVDKMLDHINKRHLRDSDVYKAAQIDRRLYSKIISDRNYKPAKDTCVAFAFALKLTLSEAEDLLSRAGYTLSHSSKRDVLIEFFFNEHLYDLTQINEVLYRLDQKVIGR